MNDVSRLLDGHADEGGASAVEYALMVSLIALVIFAAVGALGLTVGGLYTPVLSRF
jgi:Flp pilus assembly pilin Flp